MGAKTPEECDARIIAAINKGDLKAAAAEYDDEAIFVTEGQPAPVRETLEAFISMKPSINLEVKTMSQAGNIAQLRASWKLTGQGPDGPMEMSGNSMEVMRRQADGTWKMLIDNPNGSD